MNILEEIILHQRLLVSENKRKKSYSQMERSGVFGQERRILLSQSGPAIIAEYKRFSPSLPDLCSLPCSRVVQDYEQAGAAALSVLTNNRYFGGSEADLLAAREVTVLPLLRKDFIVDEYQIPESRAAGADIILLVAAALSREEVRRFSTLARELELTVFLEITREEDLDYLRPEINWVGVNNRDLTSFSVSTERSERLAELIPSEFFRVSESGISSPATVADFYKRDFQGFLIGEHFLKSADPGAQCASFIKDVKELL